MRRFTIPVLLILLFGAAAFGLAELAAVRKQEAAIASLEQARAALEKRIRELEKQNRELAAQPPPAVAEPEPMVAAGEDARGEGAPPPPSGGTPGGRFGGRPDFGRFAAMLNDPEVRRLMTVQQKAALDNRYSSLFKAMNLSPQDLDKFKNLLVEKQSTIADVIGAARKEGLDPRTNRDEIRQLVQNAQAEVDTSIRSTLGDAAYDQYKSFETTQPQRNTVNQLAQRLSYSSTPLGDTQSEQLVSILAVSANSANTGNNNNNGGGGNGMFRAGGFGAGGTGGTAKITDAAVTQAQGFLSAQQLSALQSLQQEQQAAADLARQMREARQRNNATTTTAGGAATPPTTAATGGK